MNTTLILYDSLYGNTEKIALALGAALNAALPSQAPVPVTPVSQFDPDQLAALSLLAVGSPTQRFRPTPAVTALLKGLPSNALQGVKVAAFDTRLTEVEIHRNRILAFFVSIYGYAARPIARLLQKKGGKLLLLPEGFLVESMEGPLLAGELERAAEWARRLASAAAGMAEIA